MIATVPPAGTKAPAGTKIKLIVSGGFPELTYDDGKNILLANGANGKRLPAVAKGPTLDTDPTFSADGTKIAYVGNRRVFVRDMSKPDSTAVAVTQPGDKFSDLAWAPTVRPERDRDVPRQVARRQPQGPGPLPAPGQQGPAAPQCLNEPDFNVLKTVRWAPDGKSLFALGTKPT